MPNLPVQYVCPKSRLPLVAMPAHLAERLSATIEKSGVFNRGGYLVREPSREYLMTVDGFRAYPCVAGVPLLKSIDAIALGSAEERQTPVPTNNISKLRSEFDWWIKLRREHPILYADHFRTCFLEHFGFPEPFFQNKRMLDLGCGPLGTLEWAADASVRVGADPLSLSYQQIGAANHRMQYVSCEAERLPFPDEYFDVVSSFNSLDHVDQLEPVIKEIERVISPGGYFLLLSDIHDEPTVNEPSCFDWNVAVNFSSLDVVLEEHFEKHLSGMYDSLFARKNYDHNNSTKRYGILSIKFQKEGRNKAEQRNAQTGLDRLGRDLAINTSLDQSDIRRISNSLPRYVREVVFEGLRKLVEADAKTMMHPGEPTTEDPLMNAAMKAVLERHFGTAIAPERMGDEIKRLFLDYGFIIETLIIEVLRLIQEETQRTNNRVEALTQELFDAILNG